MSDWELLCRITQKYKVDYVPDSLVRVYINHGHQQLSFREDKDRLKNQIKFHTWFLDRFADVFGQHPERSWFHLSMLARNNFILGNRKEAWSAWRKLIRIRHDIRSLLLPITSLFA